MLCLIPEEVTDAMRVTNVAEPKPAAAAWVSGTVFYAVGTIVSDPTSFREYKRNAVPIVLVWVTATVYAIGDVRQSSTSTAWFWRKTAGAGAVDPSADSTNWQALETVSPSLNTLQWTDIGAYERIFVPGTTYALLDETILPGTHRKYLRKSAGASNIAPNIDTASWEDIGPTNAGAMWDRLRNTRTVQSGPIVTTVTLGKRATAVAVLGLVTTNIKIEVFKTVTTVSGDVVTTVEQSLFSTEIKGLYRNTRSWSQYFFGKFKRKKAVLITGIPPYFGATFRITLTNTRGDTECGSVGIGTPVDMGKAQQSAVSGALNFSEVERDKFGRAKLIPSRSVPKIDVVTTIKNKLVDDLRDLREDANAITCIYSAVDGDSDSDLFDAFLIEGVYKEFTITSGKVTSQVNLQVEEV